MKAYNPYLPEGVYIPDGEPHVFDGRVYIFGSHDVFGSPNYCEGDYEAWSAPVTDLSDWRCDGVIFPRTNVQNPTGEKCMWAPDVCRGRDGKYYLYFCFGFENAVHAAVCDTPAGSYRYLGAVHHPDGTLYGSAEGDKMCFDPGVWCAEDGTVYLYSGFCPNGFLLNLIRGGGTQNIDGQGSQVVHLAEDMLTVLEAPRMLLPGYENAEGTGFEGHSFFEASSMRKFGDTFYMIYSSEKSHELCYAVSQYPDRDFRFGGALISNGDIGLDGVTEQNPRNYWGNNHGSLEEISGKLYLFYHRQTNRSETARQGCAEQVSLENGVIRQVEITSQGMSGAPLTAAGTYSASLACNLWSGEGAVHCGFGTPPQVFAAHPAITQELISGNVRQYIGGMRSGSTAGFKYFAFENTTSIGLTVRGSGMLDIRLSESGEVIGSVIADTEAWETVWTAAEPISGVYPVYITYRGDLCADILAVHFA